MAKLGPFFTAHLILSHGKIQRLRQYEQLVLCHYIPIMSQLWLTYHPRSTVALLDPQLLVPEETDDGTRAGNPLVINRALDV